MNYCLLNVELKYFLLSGRLLFVASMFDGEEEFESTAVAVLYVNVATME